MADENEDYVYDEVRGEWRPAAEMAAAATADAGSVRPQDLVATDQLFPDRTGEIYHLAYHPDQRWYHAPRMTRDEVLAGTASTTAAPASHRIAPFHCRSSSRTPRRGRASNCAAWR